MPQTTANPPPEPPSSPTLMPGRLTLADLFLTEESHLLRLATGITGDFAAAQDIVQDAFLRLHPRYAGIEQPRAWLVTAVRRLALDHLRRRKPGAAVEALADLPVETGHRCDEHAENVASLRLCLADLPPRDRELVKLRFEDDLDYAGIAARTGLSVGNVGYRLHHTLKRLGAAMLRIENADTPHLG